MTAAELTVKITADIRGLEEKLIAASAALREFKRSAEGTGASVNQMSRDAESAARNVDKVAQSSDNADKKTSALSRAAGFLARNWQFVVPALAAASFGVLALTGNLGFLGAIIPVLTAALSVFLLPLTSLAAIVIGFIPPLTLFLGMFGGLGAVFFLAAKAAFKGKDGFTEIGNAVKTLTANFQGFLTVVGQRLLPIWWQLIGAAADALRYLTKLAHMPLADAFRSLSTTGVSKLNEFVVQAGHILAKPFRLAVHFAFANNNMEHAMAGWAQRLSNFMFGRTITVPSGVRGGRGVSTMTEHVPGALSPIVAWFNRQDFTATGARWGHELAKGIMYSLASVLKSALHSSTALGSGLGGIIGAIIGTAVNPGAGTLVGGALGAGLGAVLGHYWAPLKAKAIQTWSEIKSFTEGVLHTIGAAIIAFLGPKVWANIKQTASTTWRLVQQMGRDAFMVVRATAMLVWAVLKLIWTVIDTLIIKTGVWKVGVLLIRGVVSLLATAFRAIITVIAAIIHWIAKAYTWVAHNLTSAVNALTGAWNSVAGVVGTIVGDIQTAVGWAQSLLNVLGQSSGAVTRHNYAAHHSGSPVGRHAAGGIITRPLMAMGHLFGEAGPEAVVPLNRARDFGFGRGGGDTHIHLGPTYGTSPQLVARELARIIQPYLGNTPSISIAGG